MIASSPFTAGFASRNRVATERLAALTTFRIGGPATVALLDDPADLAEAAGRGARWLGKGANLLVGDEGLSGPVVRLGHGFDFIREQGREDGRTIIVAGAATDLARLIGHCLAAGLAGPEVLAGVPATVGGAVRMNAGTAHGWILDLVRRIEVLLPGDERPRWIERSALPCGYRTSGLPAGALVTACELALAPGDPAALRSRATALKQAKAASQPLALPSAGCVFRNPARDLPAGRLVDELGLKGRRCGGAEISAVHGNFIVNPERDASALDVVRLVRLIRRTAWRQRGIVLTMEVEAWSCPDELAAHPDDLPAEDG